MGVPQRNTHEEPDDEGGKAGADARGDVAAVDREPLDLERITADLDGVDAALRRLDDGTYWTDEVTGEPIPDPVLDTNPVARRTAVT